MKVLRTLIAAFLLAALFLAGQESADPGADKQAQVRYSAVDLFVDSAGEPLAAYQLTFSTLGNGAKIVGIEGGESAAFKNPPYYDPKAIQHDRAILAAFNTASPEGLPAGKTRVATVHIQITGEGEPQFELKLHTAASSHGELISVQTSFMERNQNE